MAATQDPSPVDHHTPLSTSSELIKSATTPLSLHSAVYARRHEYIRPHRIRIKIGTWNVAACPGTDHDLGRWFVDGMDADPRLANTDVHANIAVEPEPSTESTNIAATNTNTVGKDGTSDPSAVRLVGGDKIGLYVLGLQEVVDLNLASQYVSRVYVDAASSILEKWKVALDLALPDGYRLVASEQMSGLLLLVYAAPELAPIVSHVSTSAVGTGLLGMLGNKGAVSARLVLGETTRLVFVNSHLASGNDPSHLERRCWDANHIETRTQFEPYCPPGAPETTDPEKLDAADFAFWFGDLNFRLSDLPGQDIRRLLTLHALGEYGTTSKTSAAEIDQTDNEGVTAPGRSLAGDYAVVLSPASRSSTNADNTNDDDKGGDGDGDSVKVLPLLPDPDDFAPDPSDDPASLQATLDSLLPHDQLRRMIQEHRAFHIGWREGHISFLPSYKYDIGTVSLFDSSEKQRPPSWCDRILYRTRKDRADCEERIKLESEASKRDEEMKSRGLGLPSDDDEILFEYQPDIDGERDQAVRASSFKPSFDYDEYDDGDDNETDWTVANQTTEQAAFTADSIHLDIYTSHQRIQSSDHKPVVSVFRVNFDAVVPSLKAKVYAEVAKDLDREENEGRPTVTVVVDRGTPPVEGHTQTPDEAIDFGPIAYLQKATASLTIANTGRVPAVFSFAETSSALDDGLGSSVAPTYRWLTTAFVRQDKGAGEENDNAEGSSQEVSLEPGDTVSALLEISVDDIAFARMLNEGASSLESVLILRVAGGRDHFIPVHGHWLPTCIGRSLEELIRVPDGGIRPFLLRSIGLDNEETPSRVRGRGEPTNGSIPYDLDVRCSAPKELFKLTEAIECLTDRVVADEQMLQQSLVPDDTPGWPFEVLKHMPDNEPLISVISALDNDRPVLEAFTPEHSSLLRLEAVSRALLLFLEALTDGVVTIPLWSRIDQAELLSIVSANGPRSSSNNNASSGNGGLFSRDPNVEADKGTILDVLSSAPHHNISFVFLMTALSRMLAELAPLSLADLDALRSISRNTIGGSSFGAALSGIGSIGRRSLSSFRKSGTNVPAIAALAALDKRRARERRYAEIFSKIVCRAPAPAKEKDQKAVDDKRRAVMELFLRRSREEIV